VGLLTATALRATVGEIERFPSGRHFVCWLGLTAREYSTGERRRLGRISRRGDVYVRSLLVNGARSALLAANRSSAHGGQRLDRLRTWALQTQHRCGLNKATVALANKLARIVWATWRSQRPFNGNWHDHAAASG
jgi:transposase